MSKMEGLLTSEEAAELLAVNRCTLPLADYQRKRS